MVSLLIGIHAALGELGGIGFLWVLIELLYPTPQRIRQAKTVALISVIFLFLSWMTSGYYYVNVYGNDVKPLIKEGPQPWAHGIFMETKEHIFLFLPFLSLFSFFTLHTYERELMKNKKLRTSLILLCLFIFALVFTAGAMGYLVSSGARAALEAKVG